MKKKPVKPDTPIVASYNKTEEVLYCNKCGADYSLKSDDTGFIYSCSNCGSRYMPSEQDIRHGVVQETMDGPIINNQVIDTNRNPSVAYPPEPTLTKKKVEYKGAIGELAKRATINIKGYVESKG